MPLSIAELLDLFPVDPNSPQQDDDEGDGSGDGPKNPKLRGHDDASGAV